jgi:mRNA interferase RelE/StbE
MGRIDMLVEEPEKQGKPLRGWLTGFMSTRAAGQRYRVVYRVENTKQLVRVYMIGIRKEGSRRDIYTLAEHLVRRGWI